jgi:hypothetical protein
MNTETKLTLTGALAILASDAVTTWLLAHSNAERLGNHRLSAHAIRPHHLTLRVPDLGAAQ